MSVLDDLDSTHVYLIKMYTVLIPTDERCC